MMTVSRAINNRPGVGEELRQSILTLAEEMGYRPNQIARSLVTNRTMSIGLIVPDNTNPFFAQIARGFEDAAYALDYNVFLVNTVEDPVRECAVLDSLWQKDVDGVMWCSARVAAAELEMQITRFPAVVLLNRDLEPLPLNATTINVNDYRGAGLAVRYLLAQGRRRIALLNGPQHSISAQRRLAGYRDTLNEAGMPPIPALEYCCLPDTESGYEAALELFHSHPTVDAVLAFNDLVAIGVMQACYTVGRRVPEDVAIIGFDDIPLATIIRPQLTTLHVDLQHIGELAMQQLQHLIEGTAEPSAIVIEPQLIVRDTA